MIQGTGAPASRGLVGDVMSDLYYDYCADQHWQWNPSVGKWRLLDEPVVRQVGTDIGVTWATGWGPPTRANLPAGRYPVGARYVEKQDIFGVPGGYPKCRSVGLRTGRVA